MSLLEVTGLRKSFGGVDAVDGVDLTVARGEMVALIGPNGAGKSTCFNMIGGQLAPDAGRIVLDGRDTAAAGPRRLWRQGVGRSFQITATFASMTVRENVQTALLSRDGRLLRPFGRAAAWGVDEAEALLARVDLGAQAGRPCAELSYGDLKRLELALALANRPKLLLMDEPTAGMAPAERAALMALVRALAAQGGAGVLFTEHDMDVVFGHADRVLVMSRGRLIAAGPPEAVRADERVRAVYLGYGAPGAAGGG